MYEKFLEAEVQPERSCRKGTTLLFMRKHEIHGSPKWPFCFGLVSPVLYIKMTITAL